METNSRIVYAEKPLWVENAVVKAEAAVVIGFDGVSNNLWTVLTNPDPETAAVFSKEKMYANYRNLTIVDTNHQGDEDVLNLSGAFYFISAQKADSTADVLTLRWLRRPYE